MVAMRRATRRKTDASNRCDDCPIKDNEWKA